MPVINIENFSFMAVATVHGPLAGTGASRQLSNKTSVPSFNLAKLTLKGIENWDKSIFLNSGEEQLLTGLKTSDLVWVRCQKKRMETSTVSLFIRCLNIALTLQSRLPGSHYPFCLNNVFVISGCSCSVSSFLHSCIFCCGFFFFFLSNQHS